MDPKCSAQDVVRCHLCETPLPPLHCDTCHLDLCKVCVGEHVLDDSRDHKMVPFKQRGTTPIYPNCPNHDKKQCEFYCKECIVPVCSSCILTNSHKGHTLLPSLDAIESKLKAVEKDVDELQNSINPKYEEILLELEKEKADLEIYYGKLTTNATQMGEVLHKEINILVNKRKTEINEMKTKHLAVLSQQEDKIENTVSEITQSIANLKKLLVSKDVCLVSENNSKNAQFRKLPPKLKVSLPKFTSLEVKRDQLTEQFGSLSEISFTEEERGNIMPTQEVQPSSPNRTNDIIVKVNEVDVSEATHSEAVDALKQAGTRVVLHVKRLKAPTENILEIQLIKSNKVLGFSIVGGIGNQHIPGDNRIFVTKIIEGGAAEQDGRLAVGDSLIAVNEANLDNVTHEEAVAALKATQEVVNLTIAKPSYIPDNVSQDQGTPPCLGFSIAGGIGNQHIPGDNGIFVTKIIEGGAAEQDGRLAVGDRLIAVNEANLDNVTHEEAVAALKATQEVVILTIAKPSYIPDNVSQDQGTPPSARKVENVAVVAPTSSPDTFIRSSPDFRRSSPDKPINVSLHSENTYANEDPGRQED